MYIVGTSQKITKMKYLIEQVANTSANVLLLGESGTGKELVARTIHSISNRKNQPFIPVNCGAIPNDLWESELFGHEKGSFTGAYTTRSGKFEVANKGSILLDEVGETPLHIQVKLLRVLQERQFERVGSNKIIKCDTRIIAATNKDLEQEIANKTFREDLFYRLNVFPIHVPTLRERKEDIPLLVDHFMEEFRKSTDHKISFSHTAMQYMLYYSWPGNVRELANIVERLIILYSNKEIQVDNLPNKIKKQIQSDCLNNICTVDDSISNSINKNFDLKKYLEQIEVKFILKALDLENNTVSKAADRLGIRRTTLVEKMKKYRIQRKIWHNDL